MKSSAPIVSIAVITYQQLPFLKEAIASCLSQTFEDFEIVVADDGSTDGTGGYLREIAAREPRIRPVIAPENTGITSNTNRAFAACRGTFIAWLGGDDLMLPNKLQQQVDFMRSHPDCVLCYHDVEVFDSDSGRVLKYYNSGPGSVSPVEGGAAQLILAGTINCGCATMVRRDACPPNGFDDRIPVASDWLHWIETARNGTVNYLPQVLGRYRRHNGNVTSGPRKGDHEFLLTLGILESRYPEYLRVIRKRRAAQIFSRSVYYMRSGQTHLARLWAAESLRLRPFHFKAWFVWLRSMTQRWF